MLIQHHAVADNLMGLVDDAIQVWQAIG